MQALESKTPGAISNFVAANGLFYQLEFSRDAQTPANEDGSLYVRGPLRDRHDSRSPLSKHPIACRSFANFAPTTSLQLTTLGSFPNIENPHGVTVWDVYAAVHLKCVPAFMLMRY